MAQVHYLISFVKNLIENDNKLALEQNKKKLTEEYNRNNSSLNKNLGDKYEQVSQILNVYRYISERVKSNKSGVAKIKSNLSQCKQLLQCNRDDLRRLWLELVEKRHCVKLLESLEEVKLAPDLVTTFTDSSQWIEATLVVLQAQKRINDGLENVPAVLPIKADLNMRKKALIDRIKSDLHKMIFEDSLASALRIFYSFGDRRTSERSVGKKVEVKEVEEVPELMELEKLPASFRHLRLSEWHSTPVDNEFWSDRVENFDIRAAGKTLVTKTTPTGAVAGANGASKVDSGSSARKFQRILAAVFSLYQFGKLQELLHEWSQPVSSSGSGGTTTITTVAIGATTAATQQQQHELDPTTGTDKLAYLRRELFKLVVVKCMDHIKRSAMSQNDNRLENFEDCRYLLELLDLLYNALFHCQSSLLLMFRALNYLISSKKTSLSSAKFEDLRVFFDESSIRKIIQTEMQSLLNAHLMGGASRRKQQQQMLQQQQLRGHDDEPGMVHLSADVLRHYLGKKKGLLAGVSVGLPTNIHIVSYSSASQQSIQLFAGGAVDGGGGADDGLGDCGAADLGVSELGIVSGTGGLGLGGAGEQGKPKMFRFANSSHALSVSACLQEMRPLAFNMDEPDKATHTVSGFNRPKSYPLVCKPHHSNITAIYDSVMEFVDALEIEQKWASQSQTRNSCFLREYIDKFIENVFLKESYAEMSDRLNGVFKDSESLKQLQNLVSQASERELGLQRPIIAIMLTADQSLDEVKRVTLALRHYAVPVLHNGLRLVDAFKNNLWAWFREISNSDDVKETHMSTEWGKDADLIRFSKSMSSWQNMNYIDVRENYQSNPSGASLACGSPGYSLSSGVDFVSLADSDLLQGGQQAQQQQQPNRQFRIINDNGGSGEQSDTLMKGQQSRLLVSEETRHHLKLIEDEVKSAQQQLQKQQLQLAKQRGGNNNRVGPPTVKGPVTLTVFTKTDLIKQLARLHESVAWFAHRMSRFQAWLHSRPWVLPDSGDTSKSTEPLMKQFNQLHNDVHHLSEACLMSIHLESRLRVYNCIMKLPYEANYSYQLDEVNVDQQVTILIKSLNEMEFALTHSLSRHKFRFVFEGLGNFISALFVRILPDIKSMSTSGVKKMCRNICLIQQTLSVLTQSHEMDLVRVKQLYELLHLTPEVMVNKIMEQGAVYEETVYRHILQIYQHSNPLYSNDRLKAAQIRLSEVMNMEYV